MALKLTVFKSSDLIEAIGLEKLRPLSKYTSKSPTFKGMLKVFSSIEQFNNSGLEAFDYNL